MTTLVLEILSRISAYAPLFLSVLAVILVYIRPAFSQTPVRETVIVKSRRSSISSLKSLSPTLVGPRLDGMKLPGGRKRLNTHDGPHTHFAKFTSPIYKAAKTQGQAIRPFVHRMSMPARCLSDHLAATFAHQSLSKPLPTHSGAFVDDKGRDSYFSHPPPRKTTVDIGVQASEAEIAELIRVNVVCPWEEQVLEASPKKPTRRRSSGWATTKWRRTLVRVRRASP